MRGLGDSDESADQLPISASLGRSPEEGGKKRRAEERMEGRKNSYA
jgi:hypothetical protein